MTSHDVVSYIRRITGIKKVGHTGTLDPSAVGVLPICLGSATKASEYIMKGNKKYRTELKLGIITETGDSEGNIISSCNWKEYVREDVILERFKETAKRFIGKIDQIPPMYSAVKINGKKLYEMARKGQEVEREPRPVEIYDIKPIYVSQQAGTILFDVTCSKGTYIRVLCEDIGKELGCGAHMSFLVRVETSGFSINDSITLENIKEAICNNQLNRLITPVETIFDKYPKYIIIKAETQKHFLNGVAVEIENGVLNTSQDELIRIYFEDKFIGLAKVERNKEENKFEVKARVEKFFT